MVSPANGAIAPSHWRHLQSVLASFRACSRGPEPLGIHHHISQRHPPAWPHPSKCCAWFGKPFGAQSIKLRTLADVMAPGPFTRMACQGLHLLRPMPGLPWPALDSATQANLWPTKSAITSMPARDADVMAPALGRDGGYSLVYASPSISSIMACSSFPCVRSWRTSGLVDGGRWCVSGLNIWSPSS